MKLQESAMCSALSYKHSHYERERAMHVQYIVFLLHCTRMWSTFPLSRWTLKRLMDTKVHRNKLIHLLLIYFVSPWWHILPPAGAKCAAHGLMYRCRQYHSMMYVPDLSHGIQDSSVPNENDWKQKWLSQLWVLHICDLLPHLCRFFPFNERPIVV